MNHSGFFGFFAVSPECRSSLLGRCHRGFYLCPPIVSSVDVVEVALEERAGKKCCGPGDELSVSALFSPRVSSSLTQLSFFHMPGMPPISSTLIAAFVQTVSGSLLMTGPAALPSVI